MCSFAAARAEIAAVIALNEAGLLTAAHDISEGGLAVALSEMAMGLEGAAVRGAALALPTGTGLTAREFLATLAELRKVMLEAEAAVTGGASPRVAPFIDVRDAGKGPAELANDHWLVLHLMIAGRLRWRQPGSSTRRQ